MSATRIAVVPGVVAGQAEEDPIGRLELDRAAPGPDILVVILLAGGEVLPETVARQARDRGADPQCLADRSRGREDEVGLAIGAEVGPSTDVRPVGRNS